METSWAPGLVVAQRYRLEVCLGRGGMGEVWRALHLVLRSQVAIKLLAASASTSAATRLLREARAAAALRSPHVVQILDYGVHETSPFIAMELLEGESLAERLEACDGPLPHAMTFRILVHVSRAIGKAHELGIVHRDLKPENVFLVRNDDEELGKVLDFGIAKVGNKLAQGNSARTKMGVLLGSPNYMSPEQAHGEMPVDWRSDLFSLALIAFECVTGRMAFDTPALGELMMRIVRGPLPVPSLVTDVPLGFDEWFARAAARDPRQRFQSARDVVEALRPILAPGSRTSESGVMELPRRESSEIRTAERILAEASRSAPAAASVASSAPPLASAPPVSKLQPTAAPSSPARDELVPEARCAVPPPRPSRPAFAGMLALARKPKR